MTGLQEGQKKC